MRPAKALLLTLVLCLSPLPAAASMIYDWSGTCVTGCIGVATLHVVVSDVYVPGTVFQGAQGYFLAPPSILLDATYRDSNVTYDLSHGGGNLDPLRFLLPADPSGTGRINTPAQTFASDAAGNWKVEGLMPTVGCDHGFPSDCSYLERGIGGTWVIDPPGAAAVPAPATLLLLVLGLAVGGVGSRLLGDFPMTPGLRQ
jgi:hypothetical protein